MLAVAPKTRAQLARALARRGVPEDAAEAVLGRFAEVGLIDDAMFANAWVESRHYGRGLSGRALAAELRTRGVPADDIKAAVGGLDPEQEIATARSLVARRLAATRGQPTPARIRRLIDVLARKGYSQALAYRLAREALEQEGVDLAAAGLELSDPVDDPSEEETGWERPEPRLGRRSVKCLAERGLKPDEAPGRLRAPNVCLPKSLSALSLTAARVLLRVGRIDRDERDWIRAPDGAGAA